MAVSSPATHARTLKSSEYDRPGSRHNKIDGVKRDPLEGA